MNKTDNIAENPTIKLNNNNMNFYKFWKLKKEATKENIELVFQGKSLIERYNYFVGENILSFNEYWKLLEILMTNDEITIYEKKIENDKALLENM